MLLSNFHPSHNLSPYVNHYWEGQFNVDRDKNMCLQLTPHGCLEIIIHLDDIHCDIYKDGTWKQSPDYMVIGMFTRTHKVLFETEVNAFAIQFKPDGFYQIFGVPPSLFVDAYEDIGSVLNKAFKEFSHSIREAKSAHLRIQLTETFLLRCLRSSKAKAHYVNYAARMIRQNLEIRIEDLAEKVNISQRQLERQFKDRIGVSPKHYLRLNRIHKALQHFNLNTSVDLISVAYSCGYFDQAHFINDFKKITGLNPSTFINTENRMMTSQLY